MNPPRKSEGLFEPYFILNSNLVLRLVSLPTITIAKSEMEFKEFEPRFKSAKVRKKPRFKFSAGLNLETFDPILSRTNHI